MNKCKLDPFPHEIDYEADDGFDYDGDVGWCPCYDNDECDIHIG